MHYFTQSLTFGLLLLAACNQPAKTPETSQAPTSETTCYALRQGQDITAVQLTLEGDSASGYFAWEPYEKDGARGSFKGRKAGDLITADFTYMIEGSIQSEELIFKIETDKLLQGRGEMEDVNGKMVVRDKSKLEWTETFNKTDCSSIQETINRAMEVVKMIQQQ